MSKYRREGHRDTIHAAVSDVFRLCGFLVCDLAGVGRGCPDLLVYCAASGFKLVEVKTPSPSRPRGEFTDDQKDFLAQGWPVTCIASVAEAEEYATKWRKPR